MENNSGNKFWVWLAGLLVACNIALIATIWLRPAGNCAPQGEHMPPPPGPGRPGANFNKQLNFTSEQNEKFTQMATEHRGKIDSIKKLAKAAREQFFANIKSDVNNQAQLDSLSNILGKYHQLIELQTYNHFRSVRDMLTASQKTIYDSIIFDVLKGLPEQPHFKGDGMRRRGPHPGDGQGPPPPPRDDRDGPPPPPGGDGR